jgi:predicted lipid carrier protein YhbT
MASLDECEAAIASLVAMLDALDPKLRDKAVLQRSVSCRITDLEAIFVGQLRDGNLHDLRRSNSPRAQVRITVSSDDLVRLTRGELDPGSAWAQGRLKVDANVLDLLRLRSFL